LGKRKPDHHNPKAAAARVMRSGLVVCCGSTVIRELIPNQEARRREVSAGFSLLHMGCNGHWQLHNDG
jgi:hypothetical protein